VKNKLIALGVSLALIFVAIIGLNISASASPDGVNVLGPGDVVGGVYITPGSRARDLTSGNHKAFAIDINQSLLTSNGDIETAWSGSSTSAVNATPAAIVIAAASGVTHCLTSLDFTAFHDATGTITVAGGFTIEVRDGTAAAGTLKFTKTYSWPAVAGGASPNYQYVFPTPIKSTAGNALSISCAGTAALLHTGESINVQGYDIK